MTKHHSRKAGVCTAKDNLSWACIQTTDRKKSSWPFAFRLSSSHLIKINILWCSLLLSVLNTEVNSALLPAVIWDPINPLFACPEPVINVHIGDEVSFVCPHKATNMAELSGTVSSDKLYENAFLLQPSEGEKYKTCNSSGAVKILTCDSPASIKYRTITFKRFSGGNALLFQPGQTYYLIGTGSHTVQGVNNMLGGSCLGKSGHGHTLKLKIRVCATDAQDCPVCSRVGCYTNGCGTFRSWNKTGEFFWNQTHCLEKETGQCDSMYGSCSGSTSRYTLAPSIHNCSLPKEECSTSMHVLPTSTVNICSTPNTHILSTRCISSSSLSQKQSSVSQTISQIESGPTKNTLSVKEIYSSSSIKVMSVKNSINIYVPSSSPSIKSTVSSHIPGKDAKTSSVTCKCDGLSKPSASKQLADNEPGEQKRAILYILPSIFGGICIGCAAMILYRYFKERSKNRRAKIPVQTELQANETQPEPKEEIQEQKTKCL